MRRGVGSGFGFGEPRGIRLSSICMATSMLICMSQEKLSCRPLIVGVYKLCGGTHCPCKNHLSSFLHDVFQLFLIHILKMAFSHSGCDIAED